MSTKSTFPIGEISNVRFTTEPPSISFHHKNQKYWIFVGDTDHPKDATQALLMYGELLRSSSVTIYDSENDSNGFNVLSSISLHTEKPPGAGARESGNAAEIAILILLSCIVVLLFKIAFFSRTASSHKSTVSEAPHH